MVRQGPRLHRLPQRLDYTLIPAPLDISLTSITEKSPLPAIIVTPSSPVHTHDFSIAFLAPPPKPTLRERISSRVGNITTLKTPFFQMQPRSLRTTLILAFLFFVMIMTHLITRQLAAYPYPRLDSEFGQHQYRQMSADTVSAESGLLSGASDPIAHAKSGILGWLRVEFKGAWGVRDVAEKEEFVVIEDNKPSAENQA